MEIPRPTAKELGKFWRYVRKTDSCWIWTGHKLRKYGGFMVSDPTGKRFHTGAHRVSYVIAKGDIPDGLQLDHLCKNHLCVNPDHLEPVTAQENQRRRRSEYCKRGHLLAETRRIHNGVSVYSKYGHCYKCKRILDYQYRGRPIPPELLGETA